jgi:putative tricarboxylic transport membrane protein
VSKSDPYGALFFLGLAVYICQQSMGIGVGSLRRPGPGLLSFGAGAGIGLLALAFLIGTFWKGKEGREASGKVERGGHTATVVVISVSLFIYTIAVSWLGFILATLFFVLFLFRTVESETWWRSTAKAVLVTLGNYLVFVIWLGVKLPKGILHWII